MAALQAMLARFDQPNPMGAAYDNFDQAQTGIAANGNVAATARWDTNAATHQGIYDNGFNQAHARWDRTAADHQGIRDRGVTGANERWDASGGEVRAAGVQGQSQLAAVLAQLSARQAAGTQATAGAIAQGDQQLQNIAARFGGMSQGSSQNVNDVLNNLGAGPMADGGYQNNLNMLFANGQMTNQSLGNVFAAAGADRQAVGAGLGADVSSGMISQQTGLLNEIARRRSLELQGLDQTLQGQLGNVANSRSTETQGLSERLAGGLAGAANGRSGETQGLDAALRQALAQSGLARVQSDQARLGEADQIRLQLAQMGITA